MTIRSYVVVLIILAGCRNGATPEVAVPKKTTDPDTDRIQIALDIFRQSPDRPQIRDALNLIGPVLAKPENAARVKLSVDDRTFLGQEAKLTPAEVQEIDAAVFRPIDAAHVESALLFRDIARSLEIAGLSEIEQAEFVFDWVARRVLLYEQRHDGLPPASVLRAGHGSATDRGRVFLAVLHQFRLDGCLLIAPGMKDAPLVGILANKKLVLFDTRLGLPVPGSGGKGVATWAEAVKQPDLLKNSKLTAEQIAAMEGRLVTPVESLSPRMKYLESLLEGQEAHIGSERISLHHNALQVREELRAAGVANVGVWHAALHSQRLFWSLEDGGGDRTQRANRFNNDLVPWPPVLRRYQELRILLELPPAAREMLLKLTASLFDKYYREPGEMLVRGKFDALSRRLEPIRGAIEDAEFANPQQQGDLVKEAAAWRERVNQAYLAELRKEPDGEAKVKSVWIEDQFLMFLLDPDGEAMPRNVQRRALSRLILSAAREPLAARSNWLFASLTQDKAERLQETWLAQKQAGKESKSVAANVKNAWLNARSAWNKYLDRNNLGPSGYVSSLPELRRRREQGDIDYVLTQWEFLQRELHQYASARLELARAMERTGQNPAPTLDQLAQELEQLVKNPALAKERESLPGQAFGGVLEGVNRWNLVMRDWGPEGNLAWIQESVRFARQANGIEP